MACGSRSVLDGQRQHDPSRSACNDRHLLCAFADALVPVVTVDPDTGVEMDEHRLSTEQRAHIALELMQYLHPKLKAVEMKIDGTLAGMTQERLDARLQLLLARAAKGKADGQ